MNNKGITYLIAFILLGTLASRASSQKGDSILNLKIERESPIGKDLRQYYTAGPSTMHFADKSSISNATVTADIEKFDLPVVMQEGRGHNMYGLSADSYYKLSMVSTVWGHAGYQNGKIRDVSFCDVIDYETLAPFVLCDDTGGNLKLQRYDFGGGWTRIYGSWTIGAGADYTALIAHRAIDPRVRNIVSDLNISIGGGRKIGSRYMIGLHCGVRIYHQNTDIDFYNPVSHAITMVYTGLGSTASRFKGADAQSSTHRLTEFNAGLRFVPVAHDDCFFASVSGRLANAGMILDGYNNLKFGSTATLTVDGSISRLVSMGRFSIFPTVSGYYIDRTATENLFGSSAENYDKIGERENYHHTRYGATLNIPVSWRPAGLGALITLDLRGGMLNDKEYLVEPARSLKSDYFTGGVTLDAEKKLGSNWALGLKLGYDGRFVSSTSADWAGLDLTSPEGLMCLSNYNMSSCDMSSLHAGITVSRSIKTTVVSLSARYERYDYKSLTDGDLFITGLSLSF